jgi:hypothetical protein
VYPNPFRDEIKVSASEVVEVNIVNALGQIIKKETIDKNGSIDTSVIPTGVYMIQIKIESGSRTLKMIKQ